MTTNTNPSALVFNLAVNTNASSLPSQLQSLFDSILLLNANGTEEVFALKGMNLNEAAFFTNLIIPSGFAWLPFVDGVFQTAQTPLTEDCAFPLLVSAAQAGSTENELTHNRPTGMGDVGGHGCVTSRLVSPSSSEIMAFTYSGSLTIMSAEGRIEAQPAPANGWVLILGLLPNLSWIYLAFESTAAALEFVQTVEAKVLIDPLNVKWADVGIPVWNDALRCFVSRPSTDPSVHA